MRKDLKPNWKQNSEILKYLSLITQLGLTVVSAILICFFIFLFLDRKFQTGGILVGLGVILGVVAGGLAAYRLLKRSILKEDDEDNEEMED